MSGPPPSNPERPDFSQAVRPPSGNDGEEPRQIFKRLEDYILGSFGSLDRVNSSFSTHAPPRSSATGSERPSQRGPAPKREPLPALSETNSVMGLHPKPLPLGEVAENDPWSTGGAPDLSPPLAKPTSRRGSSSSLASPRIDWHELNEWYLVVLNAAEPWRRVYGEITRNGQFRCPSEVGLLHLELRLLEAQEHIHWVLVSATEALLKHPGRPLTDPDHLRFLLIFLENPLLRRGFRFFRGTAMPGPDGQHGDITKRIFGLMTHASVDCQEHLVSWFARYPLTHFMQTKDLVSSFLTICLAHRYGSGGQEGEEEGIGSDGPRHSAGNIGSAEDQAAEPERAAYRCGWEIRAATRVMALLFAANNSENLRRGDHQGLPRISKSTIREAEYAHGQILPTSDFYHFRVNMIHPVDDFVAWESGHNTFSFCQYPCVLTMWAKTQILRHDAARKKTTQATEAGSAPSRRIPTSGLVLDVRRDCVVQDGLRAISGMVGYRSQQSLQIDFRSEDGVYHGSFRKVWLKLFAREVFSPLRGMFAYDEDSRHCYFDPNSLETPDQFFLVGVVLGLAIYNSTVLDVALPTFVFRQLMASAPQSMTAPPAHPQPRMSYGLDDLAEYRPRVAKSLRQLLRFDGDVENTFCLDFGLDVYSYGAVVKVPLCPGGESRPVTNRNRREYVDLYVKHALETSIAHLSEPFHRGFWAVCAGTAMSIFRPEEVKLLLRGSDEALDVASIRAASLPPPAGAQGPGWFEPVFEWFWQTFQEAEPGNQHKLLAFITGNGRITATEASVISLRLTCAGDDQGRFPTVNRCFNGLSLYRYATKEKLEQMLWRAVHESEASD